MATILVVDDRPTNREFLVTLFGYANHRCLQAGNGAEALALARAERPDLIVTDLFMPTMDGHEFVQRLRAEPAPVSNIPVIFYSATYTVPEVRSMAEGCGVKTVLPKPSDPEVILSAVNRELGLAPSEGLSASLRPDALDFKRGVDPAEEPGGSLDACLAELRSTAHLLEEMAQDGQPWTFAGGTLRPLSDRLSQTVQRLRKATSRRVAIDELSLRLLHEMDTGAMVELFALSASKILDAPLAAVCVLDSREQEIAHLAAPGFDVAGLRGFALDRTRPPGSFLEAREPVHTQSLGRASGSGPPGPFAQGLFLGLPIRNANQVHGWLCFGGRGAAGAFDEEDERIALSLAARLGVIYENAVLFETVQRHAARLQVATGERERSRTRLMESEQRFRQIAENIKEVFWLTDPAKNQMLYISPAYDEIWGRRSEQLYGSPRDWLDAIHPEDRDRVLHAAQTKQKAGNYAEEYRIVRPDGSVRWISDKAFPVVDANGEVYRIAGVAEDVTERRRAAIEIATSNRALRMLSACNEALIRAVEEDALLHRICEIAVQVGGYRIARVGFLAGEDGGPVEVRAHAGVEPEFLKALRPTWTSGPGGPQFLGRSLGSSSAVVFENIAEEAALRPFAEEIKRAGIAQGILLPLRDGERSFGLLALYRGDRTLPGTDELALLQELAADLAFGICTIRARGERDRSDAALLASLKEKEALLREVHHRVKNNMQIMDSLLRLESKRIDHAPTNAVLKSMQNRIHSMATLHEALYRSGHFASVDLGAYLHQLANQLGRSLMPNTGQISLQLDLASVNVDLEQSIPCGLILNELVSNAVRHAFPDGRRGTIRIDLQPVPDGQVRLRVQDDGVGLPYDFQSRQGQSLGLQLVADLARQLQGNLAVGPGSSFVLTFRAMQPRS